MAFPALAFSAAYKETFMGGDSKSGASVPTQQQQTAPQPQVQSQSFGGLLDPTVLEQLAQGGLLGTVSNPGMYQPTTVPVLRTPDDVRLYLASKGMTALGNDGKAVQAPALSAAQAVGLVPTSGITRAPIASREDR
jgi:hypothetical protein